MPQLSWEALYAKSIIAVAAVLPIPPMTPSLPSPTASRTVVPDFSPKTAADIVAELFCTATRAFLMIVGYVTARPRNPGLDRGSARRVGLVRPWPGRARCDCGHGKRDFRAPDGAVGGWAR